MCGIVGYTGSRQAAELLVRALERLEYRGYDSAGVAVQNGQGVCTTKVRGRVSHLWKQLAGAPVSGSSGIGHTRWATHGAPTQRNAHPHRDCRGELAIVHNGIVENAAALRLRLESRGHVIETETDTELIAHLIEDEEGPTLESRVAAALRCVEGTYGLAVISSAEKGKIVAARRGSPVLLGVGNREMFVASDAAAILEQTRRVVFLEDGELAVVTAEEYRITDAAGRVRNGREQSLEWLPAAADRGEYAHFMLKEIQEQPLTVQNTMRGRVAEDCGTPRLDGLNLTPEVCAGIKRIVMLACGTSWHAAILGRYVIEDLTEIPVQVEYASEYRYHVHLDLSDALVVAISQSGETADTLEAIRAARSVGGRIVGIVNVVGSTIARESDGGIYLHAGPEIGVASTKAFTSQIVALVLLAVYLGRHRGVDPERSRALVRGLGEIPALIERTLRLEPRVRELAELYGDAPNFLYLGRGVNFPVALEGALKLKEISYIHAEGLPAAEMKHGPIALIDRHMPVVFVAPKDAVYEKVLSNIQEVKARSGRIIVVGTEGNGDLTGLADHIIKVPRTEPLLSPLLTVVPLQLLAYHVAVRRGCDVDRPRNLAKSVTVE